MQARRWRAGIGSVVESGRAVRDDAVRRGAGTRVGGAIGTGMGYLGQYLGALPVLSLPRAVVDQRRGVVRLTEAVAADPDDPVPAVQLADALRLMDRDLKLVLAVRTVVLNPCAPLVAEASRMAHALGHGELVNPAEAMLRRAYALALDRVRADEGDAEALHVAARVFLARGAAVAGLPPARAAVAAASGPLQGQALVTLARLHLANGDSAAARAHAEAAVAAGCSLGLRVLADLIFKDDSRAAEEDPTGGTTAERVGAYRQLLGQVDPDDDAAYRGYVRPGTADLYRAVLADQAGKARDGARWIATHYRRLHGRSADAVED